MILVFWLLPFTLDFGMPSIISDDIAAAIGDTLSEKFKMP